MRPASLELSLELLKQLERILGRPTSTQALTFRACCVLMVATGTPIRAAARELCCQPATVRKWCRRVQARGLARLEDARRSGRPRRITPAERCSVIAAACQAPADYGLAGYTQWSASLLAGALARSGRVASISARTVQRILQLASLKPHRCEYWKRRTDPHFDAKARPILDLYLHPPADGPVVCADEKTSIQARQRLPRPPSTAPWRAYPSRGRRHSLPDSGSVCPHRSRARHGHAPPPQRGLRLFPRPPSCPGPRWRVIHLVVDNLNTHRGPHIDAWLAAHPGRLKIYYLPYYASWLNQIELWFNILQRRCLKLGDFPSGDDLAAQIMAFIDTYNRRHAHPFRWTYTGDPLAA